MGKRASLKSFGIRSESKEAVFGRSSFPLQSCPTTTGSNTARKTAR
jgi:hypothetical protein